MFYNGAVEAVFFGTPAMAVPFLERLAALAQVAAVVTNPDQPAGRGYEMKASEVKIAAGRLRLPVLQPEKANDAGFIESVAALNPDVGIVVAYGKLLPSALTSQISSLAGCNDPVLLSSSTLKASCVPVGDQTGEATLFPFMTTICLSSLPSQAMEWIVDVTPSHLS